ncbi:NPCBM/NEW2 domain-containing protein [Deinococcus sp. YIM 134068]|uniref:NPCBM/NEW2 domain-containing protein n=1 Tax=Deinococcus lichenicola TaxID=3118910 RepID=UPI002F94EE1C
MSKPSVAPFVALTLPMLLLACSQGASPDQTDPYAGGQSYPWEQVNLATQALTPGTNTLQYETPTYARNSWGPIERNTSNGEQKAGDGKPLTLNGRTYTQGYGVHAGSELKFSLKGTNGASCNNFTAEVGVDDEVGSRGSVVFQVYGDGIKLYDSGVMTGTSATKRVNVGVVGRQELRLVVTDGGNGISYDHADWADPKVECATQKPKAGSLDTSWAPVVTSGPLGTVLLEPDLNVLTGEIIARQPDGRRLVVTNLPDGGKFEVRRYNLDGSLDASYGQGGKATTDFGAVRDSPYAYDESYGANDAVLQPDGKLIVVGKGLGPSGSTDLALARYNPNGSLDPSFGSGGRVFTDITPLAGNPYPDRPPVDSAEAAVEVQLGPKGTILVYGSRDHIYNTRVSGTLARYQANGSLDTTFLNGGWGDVSNYVYGLSFTIEPDGDVLNVRGGPYTYIFGVTLDRIPAVGQLGGESVQFFMGAEGDSNQAGDIAVQADGKILVSGYTMSYEGGAPFYTAVLVRLNPDLTLDTSFGEGGRVRLVSEVNSTDRTIQRVLIQPDGKIVAVGETILRFWP